MNNKILVGSLQYSPIYKSHCCALGRQAELQGYDVLFLFSKSYKLLINEDIQRKTHFIGNSKGLMSSLIDGLNPINTYKIFKMLKEDKPDYIYMYNIHPIFNYIISKLAKRYHCKFIQHVHEPYSENKKIYGTFSPYILYFFEKIQESIILNSPKVVISSQRAEKLFKKRYGNFQGNLIKIPLLYEDLGGNLSNQKKGELITFIGPLIPVKNPKLFFKLIEYCEEKSLNYKFQLISRVKKDCNNINYKNLEALCDDKISDERYGEIIKRSQIVIYPHKNPTQSSVVLTSFMYGIPVIASDLEGFREFISHKETGYLVILESPIQNWIEGIEFIRTHHNKMTLDCRNYFLNNFSEINWPQYFSILFED